MFWDRNLLLEWSGLVYQFTQSAYVRGAVSGLGIVNLGVGCVEVFDALVRRRSLTDAQEVPPVLSPFDEVGRGGA